MTDLIMYKMLQNTEQAEGNYSCRTKVRLRMLPGGGDFYTGFDSYTFVFLGSVGGGWRIKTSAELIPGSLSKGIRTTGPTGCGMFGTLSSLV